MNLLTLDLRKQGKIPFSKQTGYETPKVLKNLS